MESIIAENPKVVYLIIGLALVWMLPWKAWALWRSARRGEIVWFLAILVLNTFAIVEILYIFIFSRDRENKKESATAQVLPPKQVQNNHNLQKPKMVL